MKQFKAKKIHMKDFLTQILNDPSRVKKLDNKTLFIYNLTDFIETFFLFRNRIKYGYSIWMPNMI